MRRFRITRPVTMRLVPIEVDRTTSWLVVFPEEGHPVVIEDEMADLLGNTAARLFRLPSITI